jgi:indolepyruvate ferredoxin oxidoreductase
VSVRGGKPRRRSGILDRNREQFLRTVDALPPPAPWCWTGPYDLLVTGVGGTGVVTVGALAAMAAHLDGMSASVLDFMGFAQKGGAVLSFVRLADLPARLNQVRIDAQQADAVLACDLVVGASPEALQTVRHGRTRILANAHEVPVAESVRNPDADLKRDALLDKLRFAAGAGRVETFDAQALAQDFLGDTVTANVLALGFAWQRGLVPVSLAALRRAIELNGVAVDANHLAFALGRLAAADPAACERLAEGHTDSTPAPETLDALVERHAAHLAAYQDAAWSARYRRTLDAARARESALGADPALPFARAVAASLGKLMAYKDEYEVARLYTDGAFERALHEQFDGNLRLEFHMAPPLVARPRDGQPPRKMRFGPWLAPALKWLARGRVLRGTAFDPFGRTAERRMERELIGAFESRVAELLPQLRPDNLALATQIAALPLSMRGFGHVKIANVALARTREAELLHRLDSQRYPRPPLPPGPPGAGQLKGVAIVAR